MLAQRLIWLLSLWPCLYVIQKIRSKKDVNAFDLLIVFHCLYFAALPLIGDEKDFSYGNDVFSLQTTITSMLFFNLFTAIIVCVDLWWTRNKSNKKSILNVSQYLRNLYDSFSYNRRIIYLFYCLLAILSVWNYVSGEFMYQMADVAVKYNDPKMMLFGELVASLRIPMSALLSLTLLKKERLTALSIFDWAAIVFFCFYILAISRTWQVEIFLTFLLCLYSVRRNKFNKVLYVKIGVAVLFLYFVIFPFKSFYRMAKGDARAEGRFSYSLLEFEAISDAMEKDYEIDEIDNKEGRQLYLYCIYAKCVSVAPPMQLGSLTAKSISYCLPSAFFAWKSTTGSQQAIEKLSTVNDDVADSAILHALVEFWYLCPVVTTLIFLSILFIWDVYHRLVNWKIHDILVSLLFFNHIIVYSVRIETGVDLYLSTLIHSVLLLIIYWLIIKAAYILFRYKSYFKY